MPSEENEVRDISNVFSQCPSCGTFVVSLSQHRCTPDTDGSRPDRSERRHLAAEDDRPDSTEVGIFPNSQGNRYAYHDLDEDGRPRCGCDKHTDATRITETTLAEAKRHGRSPCGSCQRVRRFEQGAGDQQ